MFRDDNTVLHMRKPQVQYSFREQLLVVQGVPETKNLKEMMPEILKQIGPQQLEALKDIIDNQVQPPKPNAEGDKDQDDEDDPPALVGTFEDAAN